MIYGVVINMFGRCNLVDGKGVRDPLWGSQPLSTEGALRAESPCTTNSSGSFIGTQTGRVWPEEFV